MLALITPLGRPPVAACLLFIWLGFFRDRLVRPMGRPRGGIGATGQDGFVLGPAMAVNQIAIILAPPGLGLLKDLTGSFTPVWALLSATHPGRPDADHGPRAEEAEVACPSGYGVVHQVVPWRTLIEEPGRETVVLD